MQYLLAHLTRKAPISTKADDNFDFCTYFQKKTSLDISCESSAKQYTFSGDNSGNSVLPLV